MGQLEEIIEEKTPLGEKVCQAILAKAKKLGVAGDESSVAPWGKARFTLSKDPYSQENSLIGIWQNALDMDCGKILFHGDGSAYAEFDILKPHPTLPGMQILAIEAWLKNGEVKTDLQLIPDVESGVAP